MTSKHVHVEEGGEKDLESDNYTLFHVGLRLLVITLVFFCAKTNFVEKKILSASVIVIKTFNV
jgi:hypothetical protein